MNIRIFFLVIYTENKPTTNYAHTFGGGGGEISELDLLTSL
jgi:hypothetical protein